jgi:cytochrome c peroxidase
MAARQGVIVAAAILTFAAAGCGRWVDDLGCYDDGCRFTRAEWSRVQSLTGLGDPTADASNGLLMRALSRPDPLADPIVRLGWALYYDPDLAGPPTWKDMLGRPTATARASTLAPTDPDDKIKVSCATCHDPEQGGGDVTSVPRHVSVGAGWYDVNGQQTLNVAHFRYLYWNGRADSLWSQAAQVMESGVSVNGDRVAIVNTVHTKYAGTFADLIAEWNLPTPGDPAHCQSPDACPEPECHLITAGSTSVCRPSFPAHGRRGGKVGCQWGSPDEPFSDEFDCMRPADQERVNRAYVNIAKAIAAYEHFLTSTDSALDQFVAHGPTSTALSPQAVRGLQLFVGRASCIDCHRGPLLSDGEFHNIGIPQVGAGVPTVADCLRPDTAGACDCLTGRKCLPWGACEGLQRLTDRPRPTADDPGPPESCAMMAAPPEPKDGEGARLGSFEFSRVSPYSDDRTALPPPTVTVVKGSWRTPSLRDVAVTAPYMHDGIFASLTDVVWHYDQGGAASDVGPVAAEIKPLHLSARDREDLVAFLQSLTGRPRHDRDVARPPDSCPRYDPPAGCGAPRP